MLVINTDASSRNEKPNWLIGYVILLDDVVIKKDVKEINMTIELPIRRKNETIYLELLSVLFALEYLLNSSINRGKEIIILNDNTSVIYILNRIFRDKRKIIKIEKVLEEELERVKYIIKKIGIVHFEYISRKQNAAHNILEKYRSEKKVLEKMALLSKWEEDIKELKIQQVGEGEFSVQTLKKNKFLVNLINNTCTCRYFYYNRKICKHLIACRRYI